MCSYLWLASFVCVPREKIFDRLKICCLTRVKIKTDWSFRMFVLSQLSAKDGLGSWLTIEWWTSLRSTWEFWLVIFVHTASEFLGKSFPLGFTNNLVLTLFELLKPKQWQWVRQSKVLMHTSLGNNPLDIGIWSKLASFFDQTRILVPIHR